MVMDGKSSEMWRLAPRRLQHWRRVRRLTVALLVVWGGVTLLACWFAKELNLIRIAGFPLGFWMGAQGAIMIYVLLIGFYAWVMDRWEQALVLHEAVSAQSSKQHP